MNADNNASTNTKLDDIVANLSKLDTIEQMLDALNKKVTSIDARVGNVEAKVTEVEKSVTVSSKKVDDFETTSKQVSKMSNHVKKI